MWIPSADLFSDELVTDLWGEVKQEVERRKYGREWWRILFKGVVFGGFRTTIACK